MSFFKNSTFWGGSVAEWLGGPTKNPESPTQITELELFLGKP